MHEAMTGGCLCGGVRYVATEVFDVVYCHCATCRRRSGAPVSLNLIVPKAAFALVQGEPSRFRSSAVGERCFCGTCGTPLFFVEDDGPFVSVSHGTLDQASRVLPKAHQWTGDGLSWFVLHDHLPRFADGRLSHPARR
ncbi:Glutathione-dependent formaldehyde-activating enzyme [bacterium YEK0313]|nr:Glutathione-dependent formaldehyde-activating enzyme [bacterium YEK0313]